MIPEKLQAARLRAIISHPYFRTAIRAMRPVEQPGLGTFAVDALWRLYYDSAQVEQWSVEEIEGVLLHELGHLLQHHSERTQRHCHTDEELTRFVNPKEAEINDDLAGMKLPGDPVFPSKLGWPDGLLAEEYDELQQTQEEQKQKSGGSPTSQPPPGQPQSNNQAQAQDQDGNGNETPFREPACGSGSDGQPRPYDRAADDPDVSGIKKQEQDWIERAVARQIREHIQARGTVPGGWTRWADQKLQSQIDWRQQLARHVRQSVAYTSGAVDYSYRKPSRRAGAFPHIIMPSLHRPVPSVAVLIDTSGSMSDAMVGQGLAEIDGVLKAMGQQGVTVFSCDTQVHAAKKVFQAREVIPLGGGGTDMRVGIEAAEKLRPRPQLLIICTDAETPWPEQAPRNMSVIVALVGHGTSPAWAKTIKIEGA